LSSLYNIATEHKTRKALPRPKETNQNGLSFHGAPLPQQPEIQWKTGQHHRKPASE